MSYEYWRAALAGEKPKMYVDTPECGFFRKGTYERDAKGNKKRTGWQPVAIFKNADGGMIARVGSELSGDDVDGDKLNELWSYVCNNPISEGAYREVARHGKPWPDAHDPSKNKPDGKTIAQMREENPNFDKDLETTFAIADARQRAEDESPEKKLATQLKTARDGVSQYVNVESDEMAGRALSLKNEITDIAGKLDKIREVLVRPHVDAQRSINDKFNPAIKAAKDDTVKLRGYIGNWEDTKRAAARRAQDEADKQLREHAEAARKAEEAGKPAPPAPEPVKVNTPAPSTQISAAVGRKASVSVKKIVTAIDLDKAFAQFRNEPAVEACLMLLAQRTVDAGLTVDGATIEEKSVVK